jgi:two-component system chemotaxis response regulator CheY
MLKKILITDESDELKTELSSILKTSGYDVVEAANGADALNRLEEHKIALLITDVNMPEIDGITLLKIIRGKDEYGKLPVLLLTGETDDDIITEARLSGANAWILKPFQKEHLVNVINKYLV